MELELEGSAARRRQREAAPAACAGEIFTLSPLTSTGQSPRCGGSGAPGTWASGRASPTARGGARRRGGGGGRSRRACRGRRAWSRRRGRG
uniref:Uncharacterized protein n=1 Tax=Setaria italica TaxID=4555 RepID=K4ANR9_SETIT